MSNEKKKKKSKYSGKRIWDVPTKDVLTESKKRVGRLKTKFLEQTPKENIQQSLRGMKKIIEKIPKKKQVYRHGGGLEQYD